MSGIPEPPPLRQPSQLLTKSGSWLSRRAASLTLPTLGQCCMKTISLHAEKFLQFDEKHVLPEDVVELLQQYLLRTKTLNKSSLTLLLRHSDVTRLILEDLPYIGDDVCITISQQAPNLQELSLRSCVKVMGAGLFAIADNCPNLASLDVSYCSRLVNSHIETLLASAHNLETLKIERCVELTRLLKISHPKLKRLFAAVSCNIREVHLDTPELEYANFKDCKEIEELMWKVDASVEPKLTYLNLFRCKVLYPESLADFIKASGKNLEHVDLFNCFLTTADVIVALASVTTKLRFLQCSNITTLEDDATAAIAKLSGIEDLFIGGCDKFTDEGIRAIITKLPKLVTLSLPVTTQDETVAHVAVGCPKLKRIDLSDNRNITDYGVSVLLEQCLELSSLSLASVNVSSGAFAILANERRTALQNVTLSCAPAITGQVLQWLGESCPSVNCIDLFENSSITDADILALVKGCPNMQEFHLQFCSMLGDNTCKYIAENSQEVIFVDLYSCPLVTNRGVSYLVKNSATIRQVNVSSNVAASYLAENGHERNQWHISLYIGFVVQIMRRLLSFQQAAGRRSYVLPGEMRPISEAKWKATETFPDYVLVILMRGFPFANTKQDVAGQNRTTGTKSEKVVSTQRSQAKEAARGFCGPLHFDNVGAGPCAKRSTPLIVLTRLPPTPAWQTLRQVARTTQLSPKTMVEIAK